MQDLQEYIREFMNRQGLSITALSEKLGYKSKTSLERILSGTSRKKSLDRFEEAMEKTFSLSRPELDALRQAKQVSLYGREEFRMNQEMWAFVQGRSDRSDTELHITQGETAVSLEARYEKLDRCRSRWSIANTCRVFWRCWRNSWPVREFRRGIIFPIMATACAWWRR